MTRGRFKPSFWFGPMETAGPALRRLAAFGVVVGAVSLVLAVGVCQASAAVVVGAAPTWPIPADAASGPPPTQALTVAGAIPPPADQIADPVTASATCGGWQLQNDYGDRWPASSSWWEYQCADQQYSSGGSNCTGGGACQAFCPSCWEQNVDRTDYFYWDGAQPVFYGEYYSYSFDYTQTGDPPSETTAWWDADALTPQSPGARWYSLGPLSLYVSTAGTGSGNVDSNPGGCSGGYGCQASFDAGTVVTLTATPDAGSVFSGWSGDCSGTGSCQVTISEARSVTATFSSTMVVLNVSRAGSGSGGVSSSPAGISCYGYCLGSFVPGTVVTLTALPDPGSVFAGWSGDCSGTGSCQVTVSQARSVTATFVPGSFALAVSKQGAGSGQVSSSPGGIGCGSGCEASFDTGTVVTLAATPAAGSVFAGWSGDCSGAGSCQVTMSQARSVTATFTPNLPPHASFALACTSLLCKFDASGSSDPDDGLASYAWNFGDGTSRVVSAVPQLPHTYPKPGSYTVTLTVTDSAGATATTSKAFNPISVSARGYKRNGTQKVDLSWNGASGTSFDVYRNDTSIASSRTAFSYTDTVTGHGSFTYKVCASATSVCSNPATVSF